MKKPTKKSTIPALVLGGMLAYGTIGDKVNSEYQNTTQENAQVETAQTDYKSSALENLTNALAPKKAFAQTNQNYQRPDDATLKEWMNQPVEETLAGTNYTKVNDHNYQREVKQADQPTMVLFYTDNPNTDGVNPSRGLVALTKTLHENFPEIKFCAYKLSDRNTTPRNVYNHVMEKYPLEKTPSLVFYEKDFRGTEHLGNIHGGFVYIDSINEAYDKFTINIIPNKLLD